MRLTEKQIVILEALARFKFLTVNHLKVIFNAKSESAINTAIRSLKALKYAPIQSINFGVLPWIGRLAKVHCLTQSGVNLLKNHLGFSGVIRAPLGRNSFYQRDYFHRNACVLFNILFQRWLVNNEHTFVFFKNYFNRTKNGQYMSAETAVMLWGKPFIPDWIGMFYCWNTPHLFVFEQHNGKDTKRVLRQITAHCFALAQWVIADTYEVLKPTSIFYVFESETCMYSTIQNFEADIWLMKFKEYFYFKSADLLANNFESDWLSVWWHHVSFLEANK